MSKSGSTNDNANDWAPAWASAFFDPAFAAPGLGVAAASTLPRFTDHSYHDFSTYIEDGGTIEKHKKSDRNFPARLHAILSDEQYSHIISWMPHGRAWKVLDKKLLVEEVIPKYFGQSKFASFTRQLSGWGFKRLHQTGPDFGCYYHECFLRGHPRLTVLMRRISPGQGKATRHVDSEPDFYLIAKQYPLHATGEKSEGSGSKPSATAAAPKFENNQSNHQWNPYQHVAQHPSHQASHTDAVNQYQYGGNNTASQHRGNSHFHEYSNEGNCEAQKAVEGRTNLMNNDCFATSNPHHLHLNQIQSMNPFYQDTAMNPYFYGSNINQGRTDETAAGAGPNSFPPQHHYLQQQQDAYIQKFYQDSGKSSYPESSMEQRSNPSHAQAQAQGFHSHSQENSPLPIFSPLKTHLREDEKESMGETKAHHYKTPS